jgi:ElaB/YqjD/DUF883 family membrane-anchored ribosome-binding protein
MRTDPGRLYRKGISMAKAPGKTTGTAKTAATGTSSRTSEAKTRFNAALEEMKAGAGILTAEARDRATTYGEQAKAKSEDWTSDAKVKASEFANEGKAKASSALSGLSKLVDDNTGLIDEKLGEKYGDYARSASKSLKDTAEKLDAKSLDDLAEDARETVRKNPAAAVGIAAVAGFLLARLFRSK